jgi:hypothetical protein
VTKREALPLWLTASCGTPPSRTPCLALTPMASNRKPTSDTTPARAGIRDDFPGGHGALARETGELERRLPKPPPWRDLIEAVAG